MKSHCNLFLDSFIKALKTSETQETTDSTNLSKLSKLIYTKENAKLFLDLYIKCVRNETH
jgi:hypothetical protein